MFYVNPYLLVDEHCLKKYAQILSDVAQGKWPRNIYGIFLPQNPANILEMIKIKERNFLYYEGKKMYLIGMGKGREQTVAMVYRLLEETYANHSTQGIRERFSDCCQWEQQPLQAVWYDAKAAEYKECG